MDHNPHNTRGSSVPQISLLNAGKGAHPMYAPSPNVRGGNGMRLESIDHAQHMINSLSNQKEGDKLPSPMAAGGKRKQLEPIHK